MTAEPGTKKTKIQTRKIINFAILILITLSLIVGIIGLTYLGNVVGKSPALDPKDFIAQESSKIFDAEGNLIADVGLQIRENITYDDIPQSVIDAFVSVEDSRYFEHNGFDMPRFIKVIFENLKSRSFSQGASTFTMQLVKGTYFETEDALAPREGLEGVNRKIQEIYLALQTEKIVDKKRILELYLNRINFGVPSNKRGIQTAAEFYFGKNVSELNLVEGAMLAGVINAPNAYTPMKNLDLAENRTAIVLDLMVYHGYITEEEATLAKSIPLENILVGTIKKGTTDAIPYQAYIDAVIDEVNTITGLDPVTTSMRIYTTMDPSVQDAIEAIQLGENENVVWPNEIIQTAMVTMNNKTGEIIAIGGGRSYEGERMFNRATDMRRQPGSSAKLILTYPLAFEYLGWSTVHTLEDKPIKYPGMDIVIKNFDDNYRGNVTIERAIGISLNIPAIETITAVVNEIGNKKVVAYLNSLGFDSVTSQTFDLGYGIGGSDFTVSPLQMAGAYSAMVNAGMYVKPHTVTRIEFMDGVTDTITPVYTPASVLSKQAAYITTAMMERDVSGPYRNFMQILQRDYSVYAKTGTSDWGDTGVEYGIPEGSAKDKWMIASTSEFTTAVWVGYDKAVKDQPSYLTQKQINLNLPGRVNSQILNAIYADRTKPKSVPRPDGVSDISHIIGVYPYLAPGSNNDSNFVVTGLIKSEFANISSAYAPIALSATYVIGNGANFAGTLSGYEPNYGYVYYTIVNYPVNGLIDAFDPATGYFSYTHYGNEASDSFTFNISNGAATSSDVTVNISVIPPK